MPEPLSKGDLMDAMDLHDIPAYMQSSFADYILEGTPTGGFLYAILTNDLKSACNKADDTNKHRIYEYVRFLFNVAPMNCWGSVENVTKWSEARKQERKAKRAD